MHHVVVDCDVHDSFRVQQVAGCFDLPVKAKSRFETRVELPTLDDKWTIGAIVGPSGSGKSTLARQVYGDALADSESDWPKDKAVIDCFGNHSIKTITDMLVAVGFSSPPAWVKPFHVLSNGERFRCELARALLVDRPVTVFDEFTSVVDRTVAQTGSFAVQKAIRRMDERRFVAVSCHYDFLQWLEPDWVLDMATGKLAQVRLRRPEIRVEIYRCSHRAWSAFKHHHYLSADLNRAAACYLAMMNGTPVGFMAVLPQMGMKGIRRISRVVILPDYQGVGIGMRFCRAVAELYARDGKEMRITTGHIGMIESMKRSPRWKAISLLNLRSVKRKGCMRKTQTRSRICVSFRYVGDHSHGILTT